MNTASGAEVVPLWDAPTAPAHEAPYGQETVIPEIAHAKNIKLIRNVTVPSLTVHTPEPSTATGTAVIVCPGGSFSTLTHTTGTDVANRLTGYGLSAFVLRYRLLPTPRNDEEFLRTWSTDFSMDRLQSQSRVAKEDALRAVRVVRERASTWGADPERIGIMGFSAGGLLTIGAATAYDAAGRPDFAASMSGPVLDDYAVPVDAPPLFIAFASDDDGMSVVPANLALYNAWRTADRSVEMHVYAEGGHSFAGQPQGLPCDTWMDRYIDWLGPLDLLHRSTPGAAAATGVGPGTPDQGAERR